MGKSGQANLGDIARECGLSRATVGHILSGLSKYKFKKETVELVRATARKLNYRPNQFASALRRQENKIILCIVGNVCRHVDVEHLKRLEYELGKRGYNLLIQFLLDLSEEQKLDFMAKLVNWPAGIAIWSLGIEKEENQARFREIFATAPPTIGVCAEYPGTQIDYIRIKWGIPSIKLAIDYFKQRQFQRVAFCCSRSESAKFGVFFRNYAGQQGLSPQCYQGSSDSVRCQFFEEGRAIADQLLEAEQLPEAIYGTSDELVFAMIERLRQHGIRVPDDIYVLGGGDSEFCQYLEPPLPILIHDIPRLCELAAEDLVTRIERGDNTVGTGRCVGEIGKKVCES